MRIHCVCQVHNEADVLRHVIEAALAWADAIYVLDNGSTDGTWELVQEMGARHRQVHPAGRDFGPFSTAQRGALASRYLDRASVGDWWCRLDADEIYVDDPRTFLTDLAPDEHVVYSASVQYYFTDIDADAWSIAPHTYTAAWEPARMRYYLANWSEPRFVRHSAARWVDEWPHGTWQRPIARTRIMLRHFQYRSPPQIDERINSRTTRTQAGRFLHEKTDHWVPIGLTQDDLVHPGVAGWRSRVVKSTALNRDDGTGSYIVDERLLPKLPQPRSTRLQALLRPLNRLLRR